MIKNLKVFISCPSSSGGLAEYANYQARALSNKAESLKSKFGNSEAWEVLVLCSPNFLDGRKVGYKKAAVFSRIAGRVGELADRSLKIIGEQWRLAWEVARRRPDVVLLQALVSKY